MEAKPAHAVTLEVSVISGQNICVDRSSMAENVYVVVRAESLNCCTTKMVNEDRGLLAWNEKLLLDIPNHARSVTFEVQCKKYKGVRPIGVARIALSDFLTDDKSSSLQMLSYGLRDWDGKRNGVIHFSVKVKTPQQENHSCSEMNSSGLAENEVMGFQVDQKNSSNVVIGIPVWWS
ncbi:C2 domain [Sesbania bispinosa]|nr:C2 domain [Sesbania bispinosa]